MWQIWTGAELLFQILLFPTFATNFKMYQQAAVIPHLCDSTKH